MATKYCDHCQRPVEARRQIGVGTLILVLLTGLIWLIFIPFYTKRCPICKGISLSKISKNPQITDYNSIKCSCGHISLKNHKFCEKCGKALVNWKAGYYAMDHYTSWSEPAITITSLYDVCLTGRSWRSWPGHDGFWILPGICGHYLARGSEILYLVASWVMAGNVQWT